MIEYNVVGYGMSYVRNVSDWEGIYPPFKMSKIFMGPFDKIDWEKMHGHVELNW